MSTVKIKNEKLYAAQNAITDIEALFTKTGRVPPFGFVGKIKELRSLLKPEKRTISDEVTRGA